MKKVFFSVFLSLLFLLGLFAQTDDPVLFTVDDNPVHVSEFLYIYQKNNGKKADFSEKSLQEYLELYTKFKLKVNKARKMQLDTIPELINELAGYRKQLSKSYLVDKEVNQKLIQEVFERRQKDLNVSHILILSQDDADVETDVEAKAKIYFIYDQLKKGANFTDLARKNSQDKSSSIQGGNLGYVTAMLPDGFYAFENVIYDLQPGEFSEPFKTDYGYHIAKVNYERPARGKIEASHIMIKRKTGENPNIPKQLIDSLWERLEAGDNFESLARKYSMDNQTINKGGYLGVFGINKYEKIFEDKAFTLENDGDYSTPFETSAGWHIIKRISKPDLADFERSKRGISAEIAKNSRFEVAKKVLVNKIKDEAGFQEFPAELDNFTNKLDHTFYSLYWNLPDSLEPTLIKLADKEYSMEDFAVYCKKNQRERIRYGKNANMDLVVKLMYEKFVDESCMQYEEEKLEEKYPDFKSLMREYDEGILLFEATKREVWDKASQDTAGLRVFYGSNKENYMWKPRADLYNYTVHIDDEKLASKIYKYAQDHSHDKLIDKYNAENQLISFTRDKVENGNKVLAGLKWEEGAISDLVLNGETNTFQFRKISALLPRSPKSLDEARGYVIADYQEFLEKNWVDSLKSEFKITVNWDVFNGLIKE
jgi:peptidyl-prolyl cis-trans isomerase SurA